MSKKLEEKASIDWNNYLTKQEVQKFLSKDDKVESAEEIIYSKEFRPRYNDLHNDLQKKFKNSWTKKQLVQDLVQFYNFGNLITEGKVQGIPNKYQFMVKDFYKGADGYYVIELKDGYEDGFGHNYIWEKHKTVAFDVLDRVYNDYKYLETNKLQESNTRLTLYHNTTNENALKINKEGIVPGLRINAYGKGSEAEGNGIWCSTERVYGYGGATITFEIDKEDPNLYKANDTEYVVYRTIKPEEIKDIDLTVTTVKVDGHSITESDIPQLINKYGKKKVLDILRSRPNSFVEPYKFKYVTKLLDTNKKYCKGTIKVESKLNEGKYILKGIQDGHSFNVASSDSKQGLEKFKAEMEPGNPNVTFWIDNNLEETKKLQEATKDQLLAKTKMQTKTRYDKSDSYRGFGLKGIDTSKLLDKDSTLPIVCKVGKYDDTLELQNVLYWIQEQAKRNGTNKVDNHTVRDAMLRGIDAMDIKVDCTCGDFVYRMAWGATEGGYKYGKPETRPTNITNPNKYGALCKHLTAMLSNKKWLQKVAAPILDWMEQHIDEVNKFLRVKPGQELVLPDARARELGKAGAASRQQGRLARLNEVLKEFIRNRRNFIIRNANDDEELRNGIKAYIDYEYKNGNIDYLKADEVEIDYMLNKLNEWLLSKGYKQPIEDEEELQDKETTQEENNEESEE